MDTLRIQKQTLLKSPIDRVWRAVSDAKSFGRWFGVRFDGAFVAGEQISGHITPTEVDPDVARMQQPYTGKPFTILVAAITPMSQFAFHWHPFAVDPSHDYSSEPMTLVDFTLSFAEEQTLLTITESGFENLPPERQAPALRANDGGWSHQLRLIEKFLELPECSMPDRVYPDINRNDALNTGS